MKGLKIVLFAVVLVCKTTVCQEFFSSKQVTFDAAQEGFGCWFPDGKSIVHSYVTMHDSLGKNGLWKISLADLTKTHLFTGIGEHPQCSPDGKLILFDADSGNFIKFYNLRIGKLKVFFRIQSEYLEVGCQYGRQMGIWYLLLRVKNQHSG